VQLLKKFLDLKSRLLSSVGLLAFLYLFYASNFLISSIFIFLIYAILIYEWHKSNHNKKKKIDIIVFFYITFGLFAFFFLNLARFSGIPYQNSPLLMAVFTAIVADISAYFGGRILGGKVLFPKISPNKTLGGYLCGIVGGTLVPFTIYILMRQEIPDAISLTTFILFAMGLILAIISIGGDLLQSYFKRVHRIKDTGNILPGHGGLFDRLDGIIGSSIATLVIIFLLSMLS